VRLLALGRGRNERTASSDGRRENAVARRDVPCSINGDWLEAVDELRGAAGPPAKALSSVLEMSVFVITR